MTTTTPVSNVPFPAGAVHADDWETYDAQPYRIVFGASRRVTDHDLEVSTHVVQLSDGSIDDGRIETPKIYADGLGEFGPLNSDPARELASALLEAAVELDSWAVK